MAHFCGRTPKWSGFTKNNNLVLLELYNYIIIDSTIVFFVYLKCDFSKFLFKEWFLLTKAFFNPFEPITS